VAEEKKILTLGDRKVPVTELDMVKRTEGTLAEYSFVKPVQIENDFCGWLADQIKVLHSREHQRLDWDNLAEELEAMGVSQRSELKSRLYVLLLHLLKWQTQPDERGYRGRGWKQTIREARRKIADLMKESPSLKHYLPDLLAGAWDWACEDALDDAPKHVFPETCPWAFEVFMARDFLPPDLPANP
jgi:uncharacterized protein DUF29